MAMGGSCPPPPLPSGTNTICISPCDVVRKCCLSSLNFFMPIVGIASWTSSLSTSRSSHVRSVRQGRQITRPAATAPLRRGLCSPVSDEVLYRGTAHPRAVALAAQRARLPAQPELLQQDLSAEYQRRPPVAKWWGKRPLYRLDEGLAWAESRCGSSPGKLV